MINWDLYSSYAEMDGKTERERSIRKLQSRILDKGNDLVAGKRVLIDGKSDILIMHSSNSRNQKTFNTLPQHSIELGQIVTWSDTKGNVAHWIVTEVDFDDDVTVTGRIERCNRQLKWQNPDTLEIVYRWCTAEKPYYSNLESGKVITSSKREYKIQLPYDSETSLLDLDKRFLLEKINGQPKAYKITSVDTITERYDENNESKGFLVLNVTQDNYNPEVDNAEHMIANFIKMEGSLAPHPANCKIEYSGKPVLLIGGTHRTYRAVFYDDQGVPYSISEDDNENLANIAPCWILELTCENLRDKIDMKIVDNGFTVKLKALNDYSLEHAVVRLILADQNKCFNAKLDIAVQAGW